MNGFGMEWVLGRSGARVEFFWPGAVGVGDLGEASCLLWDGVCVEVGRG